MNTSNYQRALALLREALAFGIEPSLKGVTATLEQLGNPQGSFASLQVAGTNGKSSTARFAAAILRAQGFRVGLYTSPELVFYNERMEVDGAVVAAELFAQAVFAAQTAADAAIAAGSLKLITEFELLTAGALWLFAQQGVDIAVLEVGLGGRWDATSVVTPQVAAITGVDFDHTAILGNTLEEIAAEKAAIIKSGSIPVLGPGTAAAHDVFCARCTEVGAEPVLVDGTLPRGLKLPGTLPRYQEQNVAVALAAARAMLACELDLLAVQQALDALVIPGRFESLCTDPLLLIDAAHNPQSARALAEALQQRFGVAGEQGRLQTANEPACLLGILKDKDAGGIIDALVPLFSRVVVTQSASARAIPAGELARLVQERQGVMPECYTTVAAALAALRAQGADVVATGSITLAGEVKGEAKGVFAQQTD